MRGRVSGVDELARQKRTRKFFAKCLRPANCAGHSFRRRGQHQFSSVSPQQAAALTLMLSGMVSTTR